MLSFQKSCQEEGLKHSEPKMVLQESSTAVQHSKVQDNKIAKRHGEKAWHGELSSAGATW